MSDLADRRRHLRYLLPSMYTAIAARRLDDEEFTLQGHAYDISVGGMRFEIDQPIEPGTSIALRIELPGAQSLRPSERRPVYVFANVVWVEEEDLDQSGPVRMACVFTDFVGADDHDRLLGRLRSGRYSVAA
jgi:hypothetical protein